MEKDEPDAQVTFHIANEDGSVDVETLWGYSLGGDRYQIDHSPFYAYSISYDDVVLAPKDPANNEPTFAEVVEKSGHRTVRIILEPPLRKGNASDDFINHMIRLGCSYEAANDSFLALDIPPATDFDKVRDALVEADMQWEHADPSYEELYDDE